MKHHPSSHWIVVLSLCFFISANAEQSGPTKPTTFKDCDECPEMTVIPAGGVTIGSHADEAYRRKGERPKQSLEIEDAFAMATNEVTLAEYRTFVNATRHKAKTMVYNGKEYLGCNYYDGKGYGYVSTHGWDNSGYAQRDDSPVVCVSWSDAVAYAKWISKKAKRDYRVPSTTEFEYALRAGSSAPWPWGNDPANACKYANIADETFAHTYPKRAQFTCDDGYLFTAQVGKFEANAFGLNDMIGNAWEWTNDCWHDELDASPLDGSSWTEDEQADCTARTPKGGGWISGPAWSRAAVRSKDGQHYRSFMLGFRLAAEYTQRPE